MQGSHRAVVWIKRSDVGSALGPHGWPLWGSGSVDPGGGVCTLWE